MITRRIRGISIGEVREYIGDMRGRVEIYLEPRDLWIGVFIGRGGRHHGGALYLCPLPMLVVRISFAPAWPL